VTYFWLSLAQLSNEESPMLYRTALARCPALLLGALFPALAASPAQAAVTLLEPAAAAFDTTVMAESLQQPVDVAVLPDGRVVVITRTGDVLVYSEPNGEPTEAHIDVQSGAPEQGLLGVVIDPDFSNSQLIYFYASTNEDENNRHQVLRYKLGEDGQLSEQTVVVAMGLRGPNNHNGGSLDIHDGNLFVAVGDTGDNPGQGDNGVPQNRFASCLNLANGKILRVSLAEATLGQPVADNPLMNETMVTGCTETRGDFSMQAPEKRIYAWGLRNPFRMWVDPVTGKLWIGDVGEGAREEVSVGDTGHYGYPFFEGTEEYEQPFKPEGACSGITPASACIPPAYDWDRGGGGTAIGGRILDGCDWPAPFADRYIFADYEQDDIKTIQVNAARDAVMEGSVQDFASANGPVALRLGTDNALYIVEAAGGMVTRVTPKGVTATANSCPNVNDGTAGNPSGGAGGGGAGGGPTAGSPNGGSPNGGSNAAGGTAPGGGNAPTAGTQNGNAGSNNGVSGNGSSGPSSDSGGCGCRTAGGAGSLSVGLGALLGALGLTLLRRRGWWS
jgi:MYXO-CTERM domain-containing protein